MEPPLLAVEHGQPLEQADAGRRARGAQDLEDVFLRGVEVERVRVVLLLLDVDADLLDVGAQVVAGELAHRVLRQRLLPAHQREARDEPAQVPGEVPEVGLVEVVDVERQHALGVHVGAEVLRVEVAVDPDAARALVRPAVVELAHVGVEQARAAAVERERVGGHLAELGPERVGVGLHQRLERVGQRRQDQLGSLAVGLRHGIAL